MWSTNLHVMLTVKVWLAGRPDEWDSSVDPCGTHEDEQVFIELKNLCTVT